MKHHDFDFVSVSKVRTDTGTNQEGKIKYANLRDRPLYFMRDRPLDEVNADEEGVGGDDAADALRYLVATKGREVRRRKLSGL